jgi:hypothetical protein
VVPHSSIDTEAHWGKSGWHGWVYGWKLHLAVTVAAVWIPLAARLTSANAADNTVAPLLIEALPEEARFVLGDTNYNAEELREACLRGGRFLVTTKQGPYPHTDAGVEVRRIFHELCVRGRLENFNGQFSRASSMATRRCPPRGWSPPLGSHSGPSLSTNWPCCTDTSTSETYAWGSKPFSRQREL